MPSEEALRLGNMKSTVPGFLHLFYTLWVQILPWSYSNFFQGFLGVKENIRELQAETQWKPVGLGKDTHYIGEWIEVWALWCLAASWDHQEEAVETCSSWGRHFAWQLCCAAWKDNEAKGPGNFHLTRTVGNTSPLHKNSVFCLLQHSACSVHATDRGL